MLPTLCFLLLAGCTLVPLDFTKAIPDVTATAGVPVVLQVECNRNCTFSDDTILFDINSETGKIQYLPDNLDAGEHVVTITATDGNEDIEDVFTIHVTCTGLGCVARP